MNKHDNDVLKANLCLAGIIGAFVLLTLIAFLFNEGRPLCIIPLLRRCCPQAKWVIEHDNIKLAKEERHLNMLNLDLSQHVFGVKKAQRASVSVAPRHMAIVPNENQIYC